MRLQSEPVSLTVGGRHLQVPKPEVITIYTITTLSSTPTARGELSPNPSKAIQLSHPLSACGCLLYTLSQRLSDLSYPYQPFTGG